MTSKRKVRYQKSTNGCDTCKTRRVKCDETRPECLKCISTGRRCDGPKSASLEFIYYDKESPGSDRTWGSISDTVTSSSPTRQHAISSLSPNIASCFYSLDSYRPSEERREFDFFVRHASHLISGVLDCSFWGSMIPQLAHHDEVVWHAIVAIGALWGEVPKSRYSPEADDGVLTHRQMLALKSYDKAITIQRQRQLNKMEPFELVVSCLLFGVFELQRGAFAVGFVTLKMGYFLLAPMVLGWSNASVSAGVPLVKMYMRNACHYATSDLDTAFMLNPFASLHEAALALFQLTFAIYGLIKEIALSQMGLEISFHELQRNNADLTHALDDWKSRIDVYENASRETGTNRSRATIPSINLREYYRSATAWLQLCTDHIHSTNISASTSPTTLTSLSPQSPDFFVPTTQTESTTKFFQSILNTTEELLSLSVSGYPVTNNSSSDSHSPSLIHDLTVLPPLYLTITLTTNPSIRDHALRLMKAHTSQKQAEQTHGLIVTRWAFSNPSNPSSHPLQAEEEQANNSNQVNMDNTGKAKHTEKKKIDYRIHLFRVQWDDASCGKKLLFDRYADVSH